VVVPTRGSSDLAPVLTTRRESESWRGAASFSHRGEPTDIASLSASLEAAIAQATANGHDDSGRFRLAAEWVRDEVGPMRPLREPVARSVPAILDLLHAEFWTDWEPIAGAASDDPLIVVRQDVLPGIGVGLTALLCRV